MFVVSWAPSNGTEGSLTFYALQINEQKTAIEIVKSIKTDEPGMVTDLRPTQFGGEFLFVGDAGSIFSLNVSSEEVSEFQAVGGEGPYYKINFDKEVKNMAVINDTHVVAFSEEPNPSMNNFLVDGALGFAIQAYESDRRILALNPLGGQVFFVPTGSDNADLKEQCAEGTFYVDGVCQGCPQQDCSRCVDGSECGLCKSEFFLKEGLCSACIARCDICSDSNDCDRCLQPFRYFNKTC